MVFGPGEETLHWLAAAVIVLAFLGHLDADAAIVTLLLAWPVAKFLGAYGSA